MTVTVSLFNALPAVNDVPATSDWAFQGVNVAMWGGCVIAYPVQVAVLKGFYTPLNVSLAAHSELQYQCFGDIGVDHVIFQPGGDRAISRGLAPRRT